MKRSKGSSIRLAGIAAQDSTSLNESGHNEGKYLAVRSRTPNRKLDIIEAEMRSERLKQLKKQKAELESKLHQLNVSEELLTGFTEYTNNTINGSEKSHKSLEPNKDAAKLVLKLKKDQHERIRRAEERQKQWLENIKKEEEAAFAQQKQAEAEALVKRKQTVFQMYQQSKQKRCEERDKLEDQRSKSVLLPRERLYKQYEERYYREIMLPHLEQRKQDLAKRRNQQQMQTKEELREHWSKFMKALETREKQRAEELRVRHEKEQQYIRIHRSYRTPVTERVNLTDAAVRLEHDKKKREKKERRAKWRDYAQCVKETCKIVPSASKSAELHKLINQLKHPVRQPRDNRKEYEVSNLKKLFRSVLLSPRDNLHINNASPRVVQEISLFRDKSADLLPKKRRSPYKIKFAPQSPRQVETTPRTPKKPFDYLAEQRKHKGEGLLIKKSMLCNWHADLRNERLSPSDKFSLLMSKANLIEQSAIHEEKLMVAKGGASQNPDLNAHINSMLIDSIKAKFAIFDNL